LAGTIINSKVLGMFFLVYDLEQGKTA